MLIKRVGSSEFKGEAGVGRFHVLVPEVHEGGGVDTRPDFREMHKIAARGVLTAQSLGQLAVVVILVSLGRHLHDLVIDIETVARQELDV